MWQRLSPRARWWFLHRSNDRFILGVLGLVQNDRGEVLLLEHRFRVPYRWGLPGGFMKHGEDLREGLARELREETQLEIDIDVEPFDVQLEPRTRHLTVSFCARTAGELDASRLDPGELLGGRFCGPDDLPEGLYPRHRTLLERMWTRSRAGRAIASEDRPGHNSAP